MTVPRGGWKELSCNTLSHVLSTVAMTTRGRRHSVHVLSYGSRQWCGRNRLFEFFGFSLERLFQRSLGILGNGLGLDRDSTPVDGSGEGTGRSGGITSDVWIRRASTQPFGAFVGARKVKWWRPDAPLGSDFSRSICCSSGARCNNRGPRRRSVWCLRTPGRNYPCSFYVLINGEGKHKGNCRIVIIVRDSYDRSDRNGRKFPGSIRRDGKGRRRKSL
mmetsp:Transcript_4209/g.8743  ORF Transcript_4209/g.8743 Transcript_4209/m.8743 type:complete len:218 (-) Transcript_4209:542-1195(-)